MAKKHRKRSAARAREGRVYKQESLLRNEADRSVEAMESSVLQIDLSSDSDKECEWDGTVNHWVSSDSDSAWSDSDGDGYDSEGTEYSELEGQDLLESLQMTSMTIQA